MYCIGETRPFVTGVLFPSMSSLFEPFSDARDAVSDFFSSCVGQSDAHVQDHPDVQPMYRIVNDVRALEEARSALLANQERIVIPTRDGELVITQNDIVLARQILDSTLYEMDGTDENQWRESVAQIDNSNRQAVEAAIYLLLDPGLRLNLMSRFHNSTAMAAIFNDDVGFVMEREILWREYRADAPELITGALRDRSLRTYGLLVQRADLSETKDQLLAGAVVGMLIIGGILLGAVVPSAVAQAIIGRAIVAFSELQLLSGAYHVLTSELAAASAETVRERESNLMNSGAGIFDFAFGTIGLISGIVMLKGISQSSRLFSTNFIDDLLSYIRPADNILEAVGPNGESVSLGVAGARQPHVNPLYMLSRGSGSVRTWPNDILTYLIKSSSHSSIPPSRVDVVVVIEDSILSVRSIGRVVRGNPSMQQVMPGEAIPTGSSEMPVIIARNANEIAALEESLASLGDDINVLVFMDHDIPGSPNGVQIVQRWFAAERGFDPARFTIIASSDAPDTKGILIANAAEEAEAGYSIIAKQSITFVLQAIIDNLY